MKLVTDLISILKSGLIPMVPPLQLEAPLANGFFA